MSDDFAWLSEHSLEIYEKFPGKWIAVLDGEIVGVGNTATEAADQAEVEHPEANYILEWVDREPHRL